MYLPNLKTYKCAVISFYKNNLMLKENWSIIIKIINLLITTEQLNWITTNDNFFQKIFS